MCGVGGMEEETGVVCVCVRVHVLRDRGELKRIK